MIFNQAILDVTRLVYRCSINVGVIADLYSWGFSDRQFRGKNEEQNVYCLIM